MNKILTLVTTPKFKIQINQFGQYQKVFTSTKTVQDLTANQARLELIEIASALKPETV